MNLLIVSHTCIVPTYQQFYAELERQTGWQLSIIAPAKWNSEGSERRLERYPGYRGDLIPIPVWGSGNNPLHVYRSLLLSYLRRIAPDAIYVYQEPYALVTAQVYLANRLGQKAPIGFFTWQNILKRYPPPFRQFEQRVLQSSSFAIAGSMEARAVLRAKGYRGRTEVIPAGVDLTAHTERLHSDALRRMLGAQEQEVLIGFVGRVVEEKGLLTLFEALNKIPRLPWKLAIVGNGALEEVLKAKARAYGWSDRVSWTGFVKHAEIPNYHAAFDILVLPSETQSNWKEQFGRVITEAMASGTPVIGSDSGEIPNLIDATGGGLVFPQRNADRLADSLRQLIEHPQQRRELADAGRQAVLRHYTNEVLAQRLAHVVEKAIA